MYNTRFKWSIDPVEAVNRLNTGIRNKALRIALNAAAAPVKQAVIQSAPKGEGNLSKATKIKVRNYAQGSTWAAAVGAGSSFKRLKKKKVVGKNGKSKSVTVKNKKGERQYAQPSRYQIHVDRGTKDTRARRYLGRAWNQTRRQFETIAKAKLREVIEGLMRAR